jgi:hypothetical protein
VSDIPAQSPSSLQAIPHVGMKKSARSSVVLLLADLSRREHGRPLRFPLTYPESCLRACLTHWRGQPVRATYPQNWSSLHWLRSMTSMGYPPPKIDSIFSGMGPIYRWGAICRDHSQGKRNILKFRCDVRTKHISQGGRSPGLRVCLLGPGLGELVAMQSVPGRE